VSERSSYPRVAARSLSILVAEDSEVNRKLLERVLGKAGHKVTGAEDGEQALLLLTTDSFDLALMDIQMPVLDGLAAMRALREHETKHGLSKTPVIAVTAHAMKSDRERCFAAGFDGFVTKPIRLPALWSEIESLVGRSQGSDDTEVAAIARATSSRPSRIDTAMALQRTGGDLELARELGAMMSTEIPKWLGEIDKALATDDAKLLARAAHTLKGQADHWGAKRALELARELELLGKAGSMSEAAKAKAAVAEEFSEVARAISAFAAQTGPQNGRP
jgi:CheY-like chemotaxis protein/HPt (histidine-containing phosphotransfer) domain-containing protein